MGEDGQIMKKCPRCAKIFPLTPVFYNRTKSRKSGFYPICKECRRVRYQTVDGERFRERAKINRLKQIEKLGPEEFARREYARQKEVAKRNPERFRRVRRGIYDRRADKRKVEAEAYKKTAAYQASRARADAKAKTPEERAKKNKWRREYRKRAGVKIVENLRTRLNCIMRKRKSGKNFESGEVESFVGTTMEKLALHFESRWAEGMSWENYGRIKNKLTWHIDHIVPYAHFKEDFDSGDPVRIKKASALLNHYTNLFPMWGPENNSKSDTLPEWVIIMGKTMYSDLHEKAYGIPPAVGEEPDTEDAGRQY